MPRGPGSFLSTGLLAVWIVGAAARPAAGAGEFCPDQTHRQIQSVEVECIAPLRRSVGDQAAGDQIATLDVLSDLKSFDDLESRQVVRELSAEDYVSDPKILAESPAAIDPATAEGQRYDLIVQGDADEDPGTSSPPHYLVGPGDQLNIQVWRNPELSNAVTVRPDGRISVPLVEDLYVDGRSPSEIAEMIEAQLQEFIQDPLVTVVVGGFSGTLSQQVRVVGETAEPQAVPYREGMRLIDVVIATGGISSFAAGNDAILLRRDGEDVRQIPLRLDDLVDDGDATANIAIAPGDIIVVPEGFFSGDWRLNQSAAITQTFSDNINRDPEGDEEAAIITEIGPVWSIDVTTARISAALSSNTQIRQQFLSDSGTELRGSLNGTATIEFFRDFFFLDASATSSRQTLDTTSSGADSDQSQVTNVRLSPFITQRFGNFADSEFRVNLSQSFVDSGDVSDDATMSASFVINSGRDFNKFRWGVSGSASQTGQSDDGEDILERELSIDGEYALFPDFSILGSIGFQFRDDEGDENDFESPTWNLGFSWQPGPRTDVQLTYGQQDDSESFQGSFSYQISSRTSLSMSYSEELETPQERLQNDLSAIAVDPDTGNLIDSRTGQAFNPNTSPFSIDDETTRTRRFSAQFSHSKRRDSYSISATAEEETESGGSTGETSLQATASWTRQLNPRANLSVVGSVSQTDRGDSDQVDRDVSLGATFTHQLYTDVNWFASYNYARRFSDMAIDEFTENQVQLGVSLRF